jgi:hypothetical protein
MLRWCCRRRSFFSLEYFRTSLWDVQPALRPMCVCGSAARSIELSRVCILLLLLWLSRRRQVGKFMGERGDSFLTNFFPSRTSKGTKGHDPGTRLEAWRELYHTHTAQRERCEMSERASAHAHTIVLCASSLRHQNRSLISRPPNLSCALALLHADHSRRSTHSCQWSPPANDTDNDLIPQNKIANLAINQ